MFILKKGLKLLFNRTYLLLTIMALIFLPLNILGQYDMKEGVMTDNYRIYPATNSFFVNSSPTNLNQRFIDSKSDHHIFLLEKLLMVLSSVFLVFIGTSIVYVKRVNKNNELEKQAIKSQKTQELAKARVALDRKSKELTTLSLKLVEKEEKLALIKQQVKSTNKKLNHQELNQIVKSISTNPALSWDEFDTQFLELNRDFYKKLSQKYPSLTHRDLRLCSLIKLNFSGKEIAQLSGVSVESIHTSRYRLRKKLNLSKQEGLNEFIISL